MLGAATGSARQIVASGSCGPFTAPTNGPLASYVPVATPDDGSVRSWMNQVAVVGPSCSPTNELFINLNTCVRSLEASKRALDADQNEEHQDSVHDGRRDAAHDAVHDAAHEGGSGSGRATADAPVGGVDLSWALADLNPMINLGEAMLDWDSLLL